MVKVIYICRAAFICKQTYLLNHSEQAYRKITFGVSHKKKKARSFKVNVFRVNFNSVRHCSDKSFQGAAIILFYI